MEKLSPDQMAQFRQMPVEYELCTSLSWLSSLRWIAGAAVIVATFFASRVLGLDLWETSLYAIGITILAYNLLFQHWLGRIQCDLAGIGTEARRLARVQIAVDWIAVTTLIHLSGGIESPAILYFFFHTTLAALLLPKRETYLFTTLATLLMTSIALLEAMGLLPHHHIPGWLPVELHQQPLYVAGTLFFFTSTVFVAAYLTTRISHRLRARQREMIELGRRLQEAYERLEALYESSQVVSSTLELEEVLNRLARSTAEVMKMKGCTIRLLHDTGTELCLASAYGLREAYLEKGCLLVNHNPLVRQVLAGEVVTVLDVSTDTRLQYPAEAAAEGIRSTLTAPLQGKRGPLGMIRVYCDRVDCFSEDDAHFLATVATEGSIAIENAMAYAAIQNLEEAKRKFILLVTHELRSPVGVIRSLLRTLVGGYAGKLTDTQTDIVQRALRRSEFLQTLIDDLLDLAASKTGLRLNQPSEPVKICEILRGVVTRYALSAEEKRISLQVQIPEDRPVIVFANAEEIDRACTNLISNAVKYTPDGGSVRVTLTVDETTAHLEVADTGIGISEEALPHLFEEFYRAPNAKAQVKQGTGLGLVITKDIVTRYNGSIRVSSTEGKGTTFTVLLPLYAFTDSEAQIGTSANEMQTSTDDESQAIIQSSTA